MLTDKLRQGRRAEFILNFSENISFKFVQLNSIARILVSCNIVEILWASEKIKLPKNKSKTMVKDLEPTKLINFSTHRINFHLTYSSMFLDLLTETFNKYL